MKFFFNFRPKSTLGRCQIFQACLISESGSYKKITFHCPRGTKLDSETQRCEAINEEETDLEEDGKVCDVDVDAVKWNNDVFETVAALET